MLYHQAQRSSDCLSTASLQGASKAHDFATTLSRGPREYLVAVRSEGQFLGEMAMFATAAVRCASVRAKGPVRVKIVPGEELMDLSPEVWSGAERNGKTCSACPHTPTLSFQQNVLGHCFLRSISSHHHADNMVCSVDTK